MKIFYLLISLVITSSIKAQIPFCKELLGKTETEVQSYIDSLKALKDNPDFKTEREVNKKGDLVITCFLGVKDEEFYKCQSFLIVFMRINKVEYCFVQVVLGTPKFASYNLNHVKDTYKFVSDNRWQGNFMDLKDSFRKVATFEKVDGQFSSYTIRYELK